MKSEKLQDAIGEIRDDYILDAHGEKKGKKRYPQWQQYCYFYCWRQGFSGDRICFPKKQ